MNTQTTMKARFTSILMAGLLCAAPHYATGQVASGATFTRVTTGPIATDVGHSFGCAWGDYDGDGYLDLMVSNFLGDTNALYHNEGDGIFTRVTTGAIATTIGDTGGVTWGDYDNDGDIDLFAANWPPFPSFLFRNDGNGNFTRVINGAMGTNSAYSNSAAWGDYDDDGLLDLVVANDGGQNEYLYRNNGNGSFSQILTGPIPTSGMSSALPLWSDYDNDGKIDLAVSSGNLASWSLLFHNEGSGEFTRVTPGPWAGTGENGTDWGDFDNDGDLDLGGFEWGGVFASIVIYRNDGAGGLTKIAVDDSLDPNQAMPRNTLWGDYDNDGWLDIFCATYRTGIPQNDLLYRNNGDGTFTRVTEGAIVNTPSNGSIGAAWSDYDNDGFLDLFSADGGVESGHVNFLYHNDTNSNRWLQVSCIGATANRSSIGARVRVQAVIGGVARTLLREVTSGSGFGGSALRVHFGLGDATNVDVVRVEWPSGTVKEWRNVAVNQILALKEALVLRLEPVSPQQPGAFRFLLHGEAGLSVRVQRSTNLRDWENWQPVTLGAVPAELTDADAGAIPHRFYRAVHP